MLKVKKIFLLFVVSTVLLLSITTAFAVTLDFNVVDIAKEYLQSLRQSTDQTAEQALETHKEEVRQDVETYVTQYKHDITQTLEDYANQQINLSNQDLSAYYDVITAELDGAKQQLLDEYKDKILKDIEKNKDLKENQLRKEIKDTIKDIFK